MRFDMVTYLCTLCGPVIINFFLGGGGGGMGGGGGVADVADVAISQIATTTLSC